MNLYTLTISIDNREFIGQFEDENESAAINQAILYYSEEEGCDYEDITVVKIEQI